MKETTSIIDSPYYWNFLYFFNVERDFYECHEHGEYLWLNSGGSDFLKGLIQLAISLYHLGRGNRRGAAIMLERGVRYLEQFPPVYEGIDIPLFIQGVKHCHSLYHQSAGIWNQAEVAANSPKIKIVDEELAAMLEKWHPIDLPEDAH